MGGLKDMYVEEIGSTYGGVCLNCGSGKCGYHDLLDEEQKGQNHGTL